MFSNQHTHLDLISAMVSIWNIVPLPLGGGGPFKRRGLVEGVQVIQSMPLKRTVRPLSISPLFSISLAIWWAFCSVTHTCHDVLTHYRPKSNRANLPWTETSRTMCQNKLSLSKLIISVIYYSRKLTNTLPNLELLQILLCVKTSALFCSFLTWKSIPVQPSSR
jgi:hypothetical protein